MKQDFSFTTKSLIKIITNCHHIDALLLYERSQDGTTRVCVSVGQPRTHTLHVKPVK